MKKKLKLFTHNDLDGVSCEIVVHVTLSDKFDIDVERHPNPQKLSERGTR